MVYLWVQNLFNQDNVTNVYGKDASSRHSRIVDPDDPGRVFAWLLEETDPSLVFFEMDIYWAHVAQHRFRWRYDYDGNRVEDIFDPLEQVAVQTMRYGLFHAKDGDRTTQEPGVGNGYNIIPFGDERSDIDFETFFSEMGAKGFHNPNYEQDNAPGGSADPGQSLRHAAISAHEQEHVDLSALEPLVAVPHSPGNVVPVSESRAETRRARVTNPSIMPPRARKLRAAARSRVRTSLPAWRSW